MPFNLNVTSDDDCYTSCEEFSIGGPSNREEDRNEEVALPKKRKRKKKSYLIPADIRANPGLKKYWIKRFSLFSKFEQGIKLDEGKL